MVRCVNLNTCLKCGVLIKAGNHPVDSPLELSNQGGLCKQDKQSWDDNGELLWPYRSAANQFLINGSTKRPKRKRETKLFPRCAHNYMDRQSNKRNNNSHDFIWRLNSFIVRPENFSHAEQPTTVWPVGPDRCCFADILNLQCSWFAEISSFKTSMPIFKRANLNHFQDLGNIPSGMSGYG